jgi:hypothetical protein
MEDSPVAPEGLNAISGASFLPHICYIIVEINFMLRYIHPGLRYEPASK